LFLDLDLLKKIPANCLVLATRAFQMWIISCMYIHSTGYPGLHYLQSLIIYNMQICSGGKHM